MCVSTLSLTHKTKDTERCITSWIYILASVYALLVSCLGPKRQSSSYSLSVTLILHWQEEEQSRFVYTFIIVNEVSKEISRFFHWKELSGECRDPVEQNCLVLFKKKKCYLLLFFFLKFIIYSNALSKTFFQSHSSFQKPVHVLIRIIWWLYLLHSYQRY